jgi:hypothetical protein
MYKDFLREHQADLLVELTGHALGGLLSNPNFTCRGELGPEALRRNGHVAAREAVEAAQEALRLLMEERK